MTSRNILTLGADRAVYVGDLASSGWHAHSAPVFLLGLSGRFALHLPGGRIEYCRSALVDSGAYHVFDPRGEAVSTMYLEPDSPEARSLREHFALNGPVILDPIERLDAIRSVETHLSTFDVSALLRWRLREAAAMDGRIGHVLMALRRSGMNPPDRSCAAMMVGLSTSRFNHLFSEQMGVSFRSYRMWSQVRSAIGALATLPNLTAAAHETGFSDSSHFSNVFRKTFGNTPSALLRPIRAVKTLY
jgi:AraC-like DNA-binding protein